jgi:cyclopropane-fatty-acyl-phospholipid synthase
MARDWGGGYEGASADAIQHHYDLSNDFFGLWLDPTRTYSCALWADNEANERLESAQLRKLDYLVECTGATNTTRVLDVGCGWGSLLRRLIDTHQVRQAVGITLSEAQRNWAASQLPIAAEVRLENWYDHIPRTPYDAIISIGAFEHFAKYGLPRDRRIAGYREFFRCCRSWLPTGGRLGMETMVKGNNVRLNRRVINDLRFVIESIFPDSELPWLSEVFEASEKSFETVLVRNGADNYARTCRVWLDRLRKRHDQAAALVSEPTVNNYERYLEVCADQFGRRHLGLAWIIFVRI